MTDTIYVATQTIKDIQYIGEGFNTKDWTLISIAIINLIILGLTAWFVLKSPIDAVKIAEKMQTDRALSDRKYQNKVNVFFMLFGNRHARGFNEDFVIHMNAVPMVFNENLRVIGHYDKYIKNHIDIKTNSDVALKNLDSNLCDLLLEMAKDIGYESLTTETILNPFYPDASFLYHYANYASNKRHVDGSSEY